MGFTSMFDNTNKIEVLDSILKARADKERSENTFTISRALYDKTSNENIEALFTKFFEIFIDDSADPYVVNYESKKEATVYYGKKILAQINKRNLDRSIAMIHQATDSISNLSNSIGTDTRALSSKPTKKTKRKPYNKKGGGFF